MLSAENNEILTRVGPGTAMGGLMRQYWIPACYSSEVERDRPPLRLMLLGERLVAFRDSSGKVGILDHRCPHRGASLFYGRNEENGLRCIYHGWKFDVDGNCLDMPNVPPHQQFSDRIKAKAYPTFEHHGLVWTYMGPRETAPPPPGFELMYLPSDEVRVRLIQRQCNWLQALEGDIDTSHFGFLHVGSVDPEDVDPTAMHRISVSNRQPEYYTAETDWGTMYTAYRQAEPGHVYHRFAHFMFPFFTTMPDGNFEDNIQAAAYVPMDDAHTMVMWMSWTQSTLPLRNDKSGKPLPGFEQFQQPFLPNTTDWFGRWIPQANMTNDYLIDREAQRTVSYSGLLSVGTQDQAVTESMGGIVDRTLEHLAPSDRMISLTRRRMILAAKAFQVEGITPPGVDNPDCYRGARAGSFIALEGLGWLDLYARKLNEALRATGTGFVQAAE